MRSSGQSLFVPGDFNMTYQTAPGTGAARERMPLGSAMCLWMVFSAIGWAVILSFLWSLI